MNAKNVFISLVLSGCVFLSIRCTSPSSPQKIVGNSSQTPNAVVGTLYEPDGKTPAKGVRVQIRPQSLLVNFTSVGVNDTASVLTDNLGQFAFDTSLNIGIYSIEAKSGNTAAIIDSVFIKNSGKADTLPPETLKPTGAIKGIVKLIGGGDPSKTYVLAFGIDRFATVDTNGIFTFSSLAEGKYNLRFISDLPDYDTYDTNNVNVISSAITNLDTIKLPYVGLPIPQNISLSYDTMKQIVTIRWNRLDTAKVKSYNIYRNFINSNYTETTPLNQKIVVDTFYVDTLINWEGELFGYQIAAVDKNETPGPKSFEARLEAVGAFVKTESNLGLGKFDGHRNFTIDDRNNVWIADYDNNKMYKYSPTGELVAQWNVALGDSVVSTWLFSVGTQPGAMDMDAQKNIYCKSSQSRSILKFDSSGSLVKKVSDTGDIAFLDISVDENGYIYSNSIQLQGSIVQKINKYNPDLTLNKSWMTTLDAFMSSGLLARKGKVYCAGSLSADHVIDVFNSEGVPIRRIPNTAYDLAMDKNGQLYCVDIEDEVIRIIDETSGFLGIVYVSINMSRDLSGIEIMDNGTIVCEDQRFDSDSRAVAFYRKR